MNDFVFIFLTISLVTGLIYFLYKLILSSESGSSKEDAELQITSQDISEQLTILYRQKKYNIVESLSKKYLEKKPNDDDIRIVLARSLNAVKRVYEAIDHLKIVLKHQPKNFEMQIFLSNCYAEVEKPMKSIAILQEILECDSSNVVAIKELAHLYFLTNQKLSAIKMYKRLDEFLYSNSEKVLNRTFIAQTYAEFNELGKAIDEYLGILEIYPEDIATKKRLIELYKLTSNLDLVIDYAKEIFTSAVDDADTLLALNTLMKAYSTIKDYEKAMEYADLIKDHPLSDKSSLDEDVANIFFQKGQLDYCIAMLKDLIQKDPTKIELKRSLSKAYEENKDFDLAVKIYKEILDEAEIRKIEKIHIEISNVYANWAMYLFSQNDNVESFKKFAVALEYCTQNPNTYYLMGNVNKLIKNFNEAISQYKKAIDLDHENALYYFALAECYEEIDSVYDQKKALVDGLKYNPKNATAYFKLGTIFYSQNDSVSAVLNLKIALAVDEKYVLAKHKLALIQEHLGNKIEAIELYESILEDEPENNEIINNLKMLKA